MDEGVTRWADRMGDAPGLNQVYLHVPFCPFLCHFCPLYKVAETGSRLGDAKSVFVDALKREIRMYGRRFQHINFHSVYFGGGTPTELTPEQLGSILQELRINLNIERGAEITLEGVARQMLAPEFMARCFEEGFNRVSFGVQSTDASLRKRIGRGDQPEEYPELIEVIRKIAPRTGINIDLLAGLPEQTFASLENDIKTVTSWSINSLDVLYYVMLAGTRMRTLIQLGARAAPEYGYQILRAREFVNSSLRDAGFQQLTGEVFVRDDQDCFVRTSYGGGGTTLNTVLALGPSAFGLAGGAVYQNVCDLDRYVAAIDKGLLPVERARRLSVKGAQRRALIMSVMMLSIPKNLIEDTDYQRLVKGWERAGLVQEEGRTYSLTELGRLWYNHMQIDVLPFYELISALRMFGSIQEQQQMFNKSADELAGFERELLSLVADRRHHRVRLFAYKTLLRLHRLPIFDKRAIGFTGVVDTDGRN